MQLREYSPSDCEKLAELFYQNVHYSCVYHNKTIFSAPRIPCSKRAESDSAGSRFDELCNGEIDKFQFVEDDHYE